MEWLKTYMDTAVFGVLGMMSVLALGFALERWLYYRTCNVATFKDIYTLETALTRHLTFLSVVSSNAPYVGLLGTVAGVMVTFYDMGSGGGINTDTVLVGLSLALKATALGLVVAIPSLMVYSACLRKVDVLMNHWKSLHACP
ncbi:MAG: TonB-system energizer ExbB [Campylobacterales bacterium]|nr:TonB-system energizer ExbB [Campylobacterales bacterium]